MRAEIYILKKRCSPPAVGKKVEFQRKTLLKSSTTCISPSPGFFLNSLCCNHIPANIIKGWSPGKLQLNCEACPALNCE